MTSEDDFQRALDADPDDWQTRLVFADWLQDRDDQRAEGYRALGLNQRVPIRRSARRWAWYSCRHTTGDDVTSWIRGVLPDFWATVRGSKIGSHRTRRAAEDAAALAFAKLPPERRAELLAVPVGA